MFFPIALSPIGELTSIILNVARAGIGLCAAYGVAQMVKGKADDDPKTFSDGMSKMIVSMSILTITVAVQASLS